MVPAIKPFLQPGASTSGKDILAVRRVKPPPNVMVWGPFGHRGASESHFVSAREATTWNCNRNSDPENVCTPCNKTPSNQRLHCLSTRHGRAFKPQSYTRWCESTHYDEEPRRPSKFFSSYWRLEERPGKSPNLNPIGNISGIVTEKVLGLPAATTLQQLQGQIPKSQIQLRSVAS